MVYNYINELIKFAFMLVNIFELPHISAPQLEDVSSKNSTHNPPEYTTIAKTTSTPKSN